MSFVRRARFPLRAVLLFVAGCARAPGAPIDSAAAPLACSESEERGIVHDPQLDELSGLAASARHAGTLWAINDSGETSLRLFALDTHGRLKGTFQVPELAPLDVEDLTLWPRPNAAHDVLLAADIGDNQVREGGEGRKEVTLYGIEEPTPGQASAAHVAFTLQLTYPDHAHDAEALFVDPRSGVLYVFAKETLGPSNFYRLAPPFAEGRRVLELAGSLTVGSAHFPGLMITAASIRADGGLIAFRTYGSLLAFNRTGSIEQSLQRDARLLPLPGERQGEALTFAADGAGVFTVSEGVAPSLHYTSVRCACEAATVLPAAAR